MPQDLLDSTVLPYRWHGSGEPLLLIAGLGGKGTSWRPYLHTAASRFSVLTFDNRGAGTAPSLVAPVTIADLARDALALLDHLGLQRVRVMGRSMGGMIAQELALLAPERVSRLVLVGTTGRADAHVAEVFKLWASMAELGVPTEIRHRSSLLWCLGAASLGREEVVSAYLQNRSSGDRPRDYAFQARACASHDALDRLGALDVPSLVVGGEDDRLTPPAHARRLAEAIPGAELVLIPDAGHLVYLEQPERFSDVIMKFLAPQAEAPERTPVTRTARVASGRTRSEKRREQTCPRNTKRW